MRTGAGCAGNGEPGGVDAATARATRRLIAPWGRATRRIAVPNAAAGTRAACEQGDEAGVGTVGRGGEGELRLRRGEHLQPDVGCHAREVAAVQARAHRHPELGVAEHGVDALELGGLLPRRGDERLLLFLHETRRRTAPSPAPAARG